LSRPAKEPRPGWTRLVLKKLITSPYNAGPMMNSRYRMRNGARNVAAGRPCCSERADFGRRSGVSARGRTVVSVVDTCTP
jgi:hypothetical protein